jgi:uncharacterized protein (TIGR03437 family)
MLRHCACATFLIAVLAALIPASAQTLPGPSSLSGNYSVRYLGVIATQTADVPVSFSGTFTFDGKGGFTVTGQGTTASGALQILNSGQYTVYSNGMLEMLNPFDNTSNTVLYGGVGANGVIFASSTESYYIDTFIGVPQTTGATNATLSGTYNMVSLEFLGGSVNAMRDTFSSVTGDGKGSFGNVNINGTAQSLNGTAVTQVSSGATYSLTANGTGTATFPAPGGVASANVLLSGTKVLAVSPDGNLFIAGSQTGFDFVIGLKSVGSGVTQQMNGLYFNGYLLNYAPGTNNNEVDAAQGSANEVAALNNTELFHLRTNCDYCSNAYDYIADDPFAFNSGGTASSAGFGAFAIGPKGDMVVGAGLGNTFYQLIFYVRVPTVSGTGVFLNPQGVVNAASFAPFTAQYSPGEVVTLYGNGLASSDFALTSLPFPTTTPNGIQVKVGDGSSATTINAPIYAVCGSSTCPGTQQISVVIPYNVSTSTGYITFQVINNGTASNVVTGYLGNTSPGVFTQLANGISAGAVQRYPDYSLITNANPAKAGDTLIVYCTGLGNVSPPATAGAAPPANAKITGWVDIWMIDSQGNAVEVPAANVQFAGLSSAGLYQINVVIPSGLASGTATLEVDSGYTDSSGNQYFDVASSLALIPIK